MAEDSRDYMDVETLTGQIIDSPESTPQPEDVVMSATVDDGIVDDGLAATVLVMDSENDTMDETMAVATSPPPPPDDNIPATYPPAVRQRMTSVYMNKDHLTPVQRAQYENGSPLLDSVGDEQVVSFVQGSETEGWVKKYGLVDHIFIRVSGGWGATQVDHV